MLKQITICVISCMFFAILGCSKEDGSTPTPPSPPPSGNSFKISNLVYGPSKVPLKPYLSEFQINGTLSFEYASGGIAKLRLTSSAGFDTTINIEGGAGQTSGVVSGQFTFTYPESPFEFSFDIWMIDVKGNSSNKLSGTVSIFLDDSGKNWYSLNNIVSEFQEIKWSNNKYIAVGNGRSVSTSPEGINWTLQNLPPPLFYTSNTLRGVAWSGSNYVVVGDAGMILSSPDAVNWQDHTLPDMMPGFNSVAWGNGKFVAVATGNFPVGNDIIYTSTDGHNWQRSATTIPKATLNKIEWLGDRFIAVGAITVSDIIRPLILTSIDGIEWASNVLPTERAGLNDVIRAGNKFIVVGSGATVCLSATSTDGLNWTISEFDKTIAINDLAYSNGTFIGVGNGIYTSFDAITWHNSIPPNNLMYFYKTVEWSGFNYVAGGGTPYLVWISP